MSGSVWNGDNVLNGGNREWAEEDAALHAYNMVGFRFLLFIVSLSSPSEISECFQQTWRGKILEAQVLFS